METFTHVSEVWRLLKQVSDRQAFLLVRSSLDSCSTQCRKVIRNLPHIINRIDKHCLCLSHSKIDTTHWITSTLNLADQVYCKCMPTVNTSIARPNTFIKVTRRVSLTLTSTMLRRPALIRDGPIRPIPPLKQSTTLLYPPVCPEPRYYRHHKHQPIYQNELRIEDYRDSQARSASTRSHSCRPQQVWHLGSCQPYCSDTIIYIIGLFWHVYWVIYY